MLGHTNFNKNGQLADSMNLLSMNEVKNHFLSSKSVKGESIACCKPCPMLISSHQVIIPGSNLFRVGYLDGGTLRQDTWYSWRTRGEEVAR